MFGLSCFAQDSLQLVCIQNIIVTGNKKTNEKVILREITLKKNDTIPFYKLETELKKSEINLKKLSLFNFVNITSNFVEDSLVELIFNVEECWYLWPSFNISPHNSNLNDWLEDPKLKYLDYYVALTKYNFRGQRENLRISVQQGFNKVISLSYNNIVIDPKRRHLVGFSLYFANQNSLVAGVENDKGVIIEMPEKQKIIKRNTFVYSYAFRQNLNITHTFNFKYDYINLHDTMLQINPNFMGKNRTQLRLPSFFYNIKFDYRNSVYYPIEGRFAQINFSKYGLKDSYKSLNDWSIYVDYREYLKMCNRFYFAVQLFATNSSNKKPFFLQRSIGTDNDIIPGYEYYQIPGNNFAYLRSSFKFEIIPTKIIRIKFLKWEKFNKVHLTSYINTFFNFAYVEDSDVSLVSLKPNNLTNKGLFSYGISWDFVTYYDKTFSVYVSHNKENEITYGLTFKSAF